MVKFQVRDSHPAALCLRPLYLDHADLGRTEKKILPRAMENGAHAPSPRARRNTTSYTTAGSLPGTLSNALAVAAQHLDALLRLQTRSLLRLRSPGLKLSDGRHLFHVTPLKPPCDSP